MDSWRQIMGIARYERTMLMRSVRFRVLGGIGVAIPFLLGVLLAVLEARGVEFDSGLGLGAFIPFYVYSYLLTIVIAFVVGDFRAADEGAGVYEVVASRPVATAALVLGKYLGVLEALTLLSLAVLGLTMALQVAKLSLLGTPFALEPYLTYLLLMTLPALVYMSALTFFLGAVLRQQTAVALVAVAYTLAVLFFLGERYGGIYDFGAFFAPLYYSDMIGLGDIGRVVEQRLFYLALALLLGGLSIVRYPRLGQVDSWKWVGPWAIGGGLVAAVGIYAHMELEDRDGEAYRAQLLAGQLRYADRPAGRIGHYDMDIELAGPRAPLQVRALLRVDNPGAAPLDTLIFTLNPGLALSSVEDAQGARLHWAREGTVIRVAAQPPLEPGGQMELSMVYQGEIDRQGFDLRRSEGRLSKSKWPFYKGDLTAWIRPNSVYLPPRSRWYPSAGVDYGQGAAPPSFATARLAVSAPAGLQVISQGRPSPAPAGEGRVKQIWAVERPVPQLSLNAGEYEVFEAQIHGVDCALYLHPGHRRQALFFAAATDEIQTVLGQLVDALEQESGFAYPYPRLSVVEVPFLVQWYYEGWNESGGLVQPGVLMVEEDVLMGQRFKRDFELRARRFQGNMDAAQIKKDLLVQAVFKLFFSPEGQRAGLFRSPLVQLWSFERAFAGQHAALLERGLPLYMQEDVGGAMRASLFSRGRGGRMGGGMRRMMGRMGGRGAAAETGGVEWDTLVVQMQQQAFADMDPEASPQLYRSILKAKSQALFRMVEAVVGEDYFAQHLGRFGDEYQHRQVSFADFERAIVPDSSKTGTRKPNVQRLVRDLLHGTHVPGYTLTRATARKIDDGWGMIVYQVVVRVRNGEPGRGLVQIQVRARQDEVTKGVEIEGGQEVEVGLVVWERPFRVVVEPFFAKNQRPLIAPLRIGEQVYEGVPKSYVRVVPEEERLIDEVVVDNDDRGFSMPVRRLQRYLRPGLKGGNWQVVELPFAFGRYETNFRWKQAGDGAQPAVWETVLPHAGEYDVAYHFIPLLFAQRFGLDLAETFTVRVGQGEQVEELELKSAELAGGWNLLGRFSFDVDQPARVELSDRADGRLYADAVRWRYVDPDRPREVYEEEVASFGNFGRGRGGNRRGGAERQRGNWGRQGQGGSWWNNLW